jgi:hypothetical protein
MKTFEIRRWKTSQWGIGPQSTRPFIVFDTLDEVTAYAALLAAHADYDVIWLDDLIESQDRKPPRRVRAITSTQLARSELSKVSV